MHPDPTPHEQPKAPVYDGSLPSSPQPKSSTSLAIALIVSAVLLLSAAGIAYWLINKSGGITTIIQQATGDGSESVKKIGFVAPTDLPSVYAKRDENTQTTQTTYYDDSAAVCGITTAVRPVAAGKSAKDITLAAADAAKDLGIAVAANSEGPKLKIADEDGNHSYEFPSVVLDQNVSVPGVAFTKQYNTIAYKQFGSLVASIGFSCKNDSWESKKAELQTLVQTFKVKTER